MVLAISSTNGRLPVLDAASYKVTARFSNISELRVRAPVKIGGVRVGEISNIRLDPKTFEAVVTLELGRSAGDIPADSSARVVTAGLLCYRYIRILHGDYPEPRADATEITMTPS